MILAGGSGTRFWPLSRRAVPKQLLPLVSGRPMVQETVERLTPLFALKDIFVVTAAEQAEKIRQELPMLPPDNIIDEPAGRDTAAAIALFATFIEWRDSDAVFAVLPADHYINPVETLQENLSRAVALANQGRFVTFGIKPRAAATQYGYIQRGAPLAPGVFEVAKFHEKPDVKTAHEFVAAGNFYWNSGMFVWRAKDLLRAVEQHLPDHARAMKQVRDALGTSRLPTVLAREYMKLNRISIDYGVMEKVSNAAVVEAGFHWSDVGSWTALPTVRPVDPAGNVIEGEWSGLDTKNTIVIGPADKLIATIGVEDLVVVQTQDATLICHRDRAEDIKKLVEKLQKEGRERFL